MHIAFTHVVNPNNCGELASCPAPYINMRGNTHEVISIDKFPMLKDFDAVVIGGGGLFMPDLEDKVAKVVRVSKRNNPDCKVVGWGLGSNYPHPTDDQWRKWSEGFDLIGVRDKTSVLPQLPCASCLHPLFDSKAKGPTQEEVVYEHQDVPLGWNYPTLNNRCTIEQAVDFISSGEFVLSGTYHGTYWALLLQRRVIFVRPASNAQDFRTDRLGVPVPVIDEGVSEGHAEVDVYPNYLLACRERNRWFEEQFWNLFKS